MSDNITEMISTERDLFGKQQDPLLQETQALFKENYISGGELLQLLPHLDCQNQRSLFK